MSAVHHFVLSQRAKALSEGIKIVRDVLKTNPFPNGFTTLQLFQLAVQQPPPPDFPIYLHTSRPPVIKPDKDRYRKKKPLMPWAPSHPEHPIRSVRFLKVEVLPVLADSFEIKKVRQPRETPLNDTGKRVKGIDPNFEFVWKVVDPSEAPPLPRSKPKKDVEKKVNVNPDYEHFDIRRQNSNVRETTRVDAMGYSWQRKQTTPGDQQSVGKITRDDETMRYAWRGKQTTPASPRDQNIGETTRVVEGMDSIWRRKQPERTPRDQQNIGKTTRDDETMRYAWGEKQTTPTSPRYQNIGETTRVVEGMDSIWRRKQPERTPRDQQNIGKTTRNDETMRYAWRGEE